MFHIITQVSFWVENYGNNQNWVPSMVAHQYLTDVNADEIFEFGIWWIQKMSLFSNLPTLNNPMTNLWKLLWKNTENWLIWLTWMWVREKGNFDFLHLGFFGFKKCNFYKLTNSLSFFTNIFRDWSLGCWELEDLKKLHVLNPPNPKFKKSKFTFSLIHIQMSHMFMW